MCDYCTEGYSAKGAARFSLLNLASTCTVNYLRGASVSVISARKNMKNMLLRRKYCAIDNTNPNRS